MVAAVPLAYEATGPENGEAVVLLHGFPMDRTMWRFQVSPLTQAGYRVILPDLRGHGRSPVAESSIPAMAQDVVALLDRLRVGAAAVVGFSMGGYVALELAHAHPERVVALALVDTRAEPDSAEAREKRLAYIPEVQRDGPRILVDAMLGVMLTPDTLQNRRGLVDLVRSIMARQGVEGICETLRALADRPDQRPRLGGIRCPALVLAGEMDAVTPPASQEVLAGGIPDAELVLLPRLAHGTPLE
ncbi:MAG TPA: alpha/beta hydrolase, partial [Candidatus Thermoplasmatota archaeon]|nr:alpha/beta hydrolase [Candidatus Thermoplasmatota archaeon]